MNSLTFWLTPDCNLRCTYCFQGEIRKKPWNGQKATHEVIIKLAEYCANNEIHHVEFFGGEPLYDNTLFRYAVEYLCSKIPNLSLGIVTNGTLLSEDVMELIEDHSIAVLLSLDGGKIRHNAFRGEFEKIQPWFPRLIKLPNISIALQAGKIKGLSENVSEVWSFGFKRVYINIIENYHWYTPQEKDLFEYEYDNAVLRMLNGEGILNCAIQIFKGLQGNEYVKECGIIRKGVSSDWDGFLYPCHRAIELGKEFSIGSLFGGINPNKEEQIRLEVEKKAFGSKSSKIYDLVSFCPIAVYQENKTLDGAWNKDFCEMIEMKNKIVAKNYYQIESLYKSLLPNT